MSGIGLFKHSRIAQLTALHFSLLTCLATVNIHVSIVVRLDINLMIA